MLSPSRQSLTSIWQASCPQELCPDEVSPNPSSLSQKRAHVVTSNGLVCVVPRKQWISKIKLLDENAKSTVVSSLYLRLRQWGEWEKMSQKNLKQLRILILTNRFSK